MHSCIRSSKTSFTPCRQLPITEVMKKKGNRCELCGYEGQPHGFFNYGRDGNIWYEKTIKALDGFLVSLGYLEK